MQIQNTVSHFPPVIFISNAHPQLRKTIMPRSNCIFHCILERKLNSISFTGSSLNALDIKRETTYLHIVHYFAYSIPIYENFQNRKYIQESNLHVETIFHGLNNFLVI